MVRAVVTGLALVLVLPPGSAMASGGAPLASDLNVATGKDTARVVALVATDAEGDPLSYTVVSGPVHGTLTGSDGTRTYTPPAAFSGLDSFTYRANDGTSDSNLATVTVLVGSKYTVTLTDSSVTSADLGVKLGGTVRFKNTGTASRTVTDPMGVLSAGPIPAGGSTSVIVPAAGSYPYTVDNGQTARVRSAVQLTPQVALIGSTFDVRWGAQDFPPGYVADVEIRVAGSLVFVPWQTGVTTLSATITPDAPGSYKFRARLRNAFTGVHSDWSALTDFVVTHTGPPVIEAVTIVPAQPGTDDVLGAEVQSHDPDGPVAIHTWQWIRNGVDLPGATAATLDLSVPGNGDSGDLIQVRVVVSDGTSSSAPVTSPPVTVG